MKQKIFVILLSALALLIISCKRSSYTPADPNNDITLETELTHFNSPQKADIFYLGETVSIDYRYFSGPKEVDIHIVRKGTIQYTLQKDFPNTGKLDWTTTEQTHPSVHYQVKVVDSRDPAISITSDRFGVIHK